MLSKPNAGWTTFQLAGSSAYKLSYLDDIAFEWLEQAIHGLKTLQPFCVKGFMEPTRFLCVVSYWNCHIICEDDRRHSLTGDDIKNEYVHISMLDFCKELHDNILKSTDEWADFAPLFDDDREEIICCKKDLLRTMLAQLQQLIAEREESFGKNRCFL